jgi:hypothetical protein
MEEFFVNADLGLTQTDLKRLFLVKKDSGCHLDSDSSEKMMKSEIKFR